MAAIGDRNRLLAELRRRGSRGGVIAPHRAMVTARLTPALTVSTIVLPVMLSAAVLWSLPYLSAMWARGLAWLLPLIGLPGGVATHQVSVGSLFSMDVPYLSVVAGFPGAREYLIVGAVCALALVLAGLLPPRFVPLVYGLRFGVLVQLTAFLYFALRPDVFPYALGPYSQSLFEIGSAVLILVPLIYGGTFFPFRMALWRKVALTTGTVLHLAILLPMQVAIHAYAIHHLSLLVMPTLFFLTGVLVHVFVFVALYGWGMSWPDAVRRVASGSEGQR